MYSIAEELENMGRRKGKEEGKEVNVKPYA